MKAVKSKLTYVDALPQDHVLLTETVFNSKKSWGYSDELMTLWKSDLEVNAEYIVEHTLVKVLDEGRFIGFFGIKLLEREEVVIDHLWLLPNEKNKGYGREIFLHIRNHLKSLGHEKASLIAEPFAKGFYDKMGGEVVGKFQSQVSGRVLDVYRFDL